MAAIGTVTVIVNTEIGTDLEAAIRRIIRDEVASLVTDTYRTSGDVSMDGLTALFALRTSALSAL